MKAYEIIRDELKDRGISIAHVARKTGIDYQLLRLSMLGERRLHADEFIMLCNELGLDLEQFRAS